MQIYTRAGLVALLFAFAIAFTTAAPIAQQHHASPPSVSVRPVHGVTVGNRAAPFATSTVAYRKEEALGSGPRSAVDLGEQTTVVRRGVHISNKVKHAFQKVKHAFQKVGQGIKHVAQKIGHGIKTAAKKVGHFIKTTGAVVAKFGLKIVSTAQKIAGKALGFIPGVGKVIGKAMEGASAATNAISNKIHVKLPGKLQKGMNVMNKIQKGTKYVPRELAEGDLDVREDFYDLVGREWEDWEDF